MPIKKEQPRYLLTNPAVSAATASIDKEVGNNIYFANDQLLLSACSWGHNYVLWAPIVDKCAKLRAIHTESYNRHQASDIKVKPGKRIESPGSIKCNVS